jgi:hypothetical protein
MLGRFNYQRTRVSARSDPVALPTAAWELQMEQAIPYPLLAASNQYRGMHRRAESVITGR